MRSGAACIAGAKADTPTLWSVNTRLDRLKENLSRANEIVVPKGDFFRACFHEITLQQILFLNLLLFLINF